MKHHPIRLRPALPTQDEGRIFAGYLDSAFEGLIRITLGKRWEEIVGIAFTRPDHDFSFQNVVFAEFGNRIVGMAAGYTAEQHRSWNHCPLRDAAGSHFLPRLGAALLLLRLRYLGTNTAGDYYIQAIAVDHDSRGKGIGSLLLGKTEEAARDAGSKRLVLDVAARNLGALRLYERYGMSLQTPRRALSLQSRFIVQMAKRL